MLYSTMPRASNSNLNISRRIRYFVDNISKSWDVDTRENVTEFSPTVVSYLLEVVDNISSGLE